MQIKLLLDNKNGNVFDVSELVTDVTWKSKRKGKPSSLEFELLKDSNVTINNGDVISFKVDNSNVFYGYVFENGGSKDPIIKVTAYDQIRYLLYNDTYSFVNQKASQIITQIAQDMGLKIGSINDTGFIIPQLLENDKKLLDIIYSALEKTLTSNGKIFVLYDDFGSLCLSDIDNMRQSIVISDETNLGDYDWRNSIDSETYNRVKLVRDNKETKGRDVYIFQDSNNIPKWGRLQFFKTVDEKMNKAQMQEMANSFLKLKNREQKTLKLKDVVSTDVVEDLKLRAGSIVYVNIKDKGISQYYLIEEAAHKFAKNNLIMNFDLKVV